MDGVYEIRASGLVEDNYYVHDAVVSVVYGSRDEAFEMARKHKDEYGYDHVEIHTVFEKIEIV